MRICMILEGSYPYVFGGVSSWMHQYIKAMPEQKFVLWCIGAKAEDRGRYKYELPENVVEVREVFLDDALKLKSSRRERNRLKLTRQQKDAFMDLFEGKSPDWEVLFELFQEKKVNPAAMLMSREFLRVFIRLCKEKFPYISFSEFFHTVRSMMLPELYLLTQPVPEADLYHATATGYSGLLGSLGKWKNKRPFLLTEHGIYTREREEELLRADWVLPFFRQQWIDLFYVFSACAYQYADRVTCLFERAREMQQEIGCPPEKQRVIENGVCLERFSGIPPKQEDGWVDIGAVVRIAKIKDIKTMIYAFAEVKAEMPNTRLHIMGDVDDPEYFEECRLLVKQLGISDIVFTGVVDIIPYMEKIDFTILTSISEGQPLSVLESFAAGRACVATDVGCCRELIYGKDGFGPAGLCVPPMNKERLAQAMLELCQKSAERERMGLAGRARVGEYYTDVLSMQKYRKLYEEVSS